MPEPTADPKTVAPVAGRDYPADLAQLRAWVPGDEACLDWLRWPLGFCCPHCGSDTAGCDGSGRYRCHGCWRRVSVTAGTIFDKTRTPLTLWFEAAWLATAGKGGISAAHLQRVLPISSYQTAWTMLAKLRQVMFTSESEPLNGRGEVDETFIGGPRPGKAGRGAAGKSWWLERSNSRPAAGAAHACPSSPTLRQSL
jgi:transposase-like protein